MKKFLFFIFVVAYVTLQAQSPITLWNYNTNLSPGVVNANGGTVSSFPLPSIGADQQWNYSTLTSGSASSFFYRTANNFFYPQATYMDSGLASVFIANRYFYYDLYYQKDTSGAKGLGTSMLQQNYGLGALTGVTTDSCIFPSQYWVYENPLWIIKFPATMGSSWHSNFTTMVDFNLTISSQALNNTPCKRISHTDRVDTVIAWGTLRVPASPGVSFAYPVLLIKRMSVQRDSFYMNGVPGSSALLANFGLSQGMATTTNRYLFWRENARYPLLMVNFGSNNFTTASSAFYDTDVQADPYWGISDLSGSSNISIYPNPNNGQFTVQLKNTDKPVRIQIYNVFGQVVLNKESDNIPSTGLSLDLSGAANGVYLMVTECDGKRSTDKIIIR